MVDVFKTRGKSPANAKSCANHVPRYNPTEPSGVPSGPSPILCCDCNCNCTCVVRCQQPRQIQNPRVWSAICILYLPRAAAAAAAAAELCTVCMHAMRVPHVSLLALQLRENCGHSFCACLV